MTAPLRFLLLVIAGWIALRIWVTGEPSHDRSIATAPIGLAAAPGVATARPAPIPAAASTPLEIAAAAATAAAQAAAAAANAADSAAAAAETALVAAEVAAAAAGVPVVRPALPAPVQAGARRLAAGARSAPWRQAAIQHASARHFREQARHWRQRGEQRSAPIAAGPGNWSLDRNPALDRAGDWRAAGDWRGAGDQPGDDRASISATLASSSLPPLPSPDRATLPDQAAAPQTLSARDRLRMTGWLLVRPNGGASSLASGGTLGDSQAGARLAFDLHRSIAASLRAYAPLRDVRGGDVAAGFTWTPLRSLPIHLTAERRQRVGSSGGRSAFALFAEGGFYHRPLPLDFRLDGYAQAGVVGAKSRDAFVDGALTFDRPLIGPVRVGGGAWGGAQTGVSRLDVGPRLSVRVMRRARVDLDWRTRVAGKARPGSGPALTIAGDF